MNSTLIFTATYNEAPNIKNLINIGIIIYLTESVSKTRYRYITNQIKSLKNKLNTVYGDQINLLNILLYKDTIDIYEIIKIFNKYNIVPLSTEKAIGEEKYRKLNNRFSKDDKKLINSMLLIIFKKYKIKSNSIKKYYEVDDSNQYFYFNYKTINSNFYNELDEKDKYSNLEFQKINNFLFSNNEYVLIRKPYEIEYEGFIDKKISKFNVCKQNKEINNFIDKYYHIKDEVAKNNWDIWLELEFSDCSLTEKLIYYRDKLSNIYMVGIQSLNIFQFINNINDIDNDWVLLKKTNNVGNNEIIDNLLYKYIIDIPYFYNNYSFIVSNNIDNIMITKKTVGIGGNIKIKLTGGYYLNYEVNEVNEVKEVNKVSTTVKFYICNTQTIHYGNDTKSRISSQSIFINNTTSDSLNKYIINLIINIENPSNVIIWGENNEYFYYLCTYNTLLIVNGKKLELIYDNNKYLIYDDFDSEKESFKKYHFITNPYSLMSKKTFKIDSYTSNNIPNYTSGEDENILFTFGCYMFEEIDKVSLFKPNNEDTWLKSAHEFARQFKDDVDYNYLLSKIKPLNRLYLNRIHNSNLFIIFDELESALFYLYSYFKYNHSFYIYDIFDVIVKLLFQKIDDDYSINGVSDKDNKFILNSEQYKDKYNIPKLLVRLGAMIYNNPESLVFNSLLISIYMETNLHKCTSQILKILFNIDYEIDYIPEVFYTISDELKQKYSNYIKNTIFSYECLYNNLFKKLFKNARLLDEIKNDKIKNLIHTTQYISDLYFNKTRLSNLYDEKFNIFSYYTKDLFKPSNLARYFYNFKHENDYFWIIDTVLNFGEHPITKENAQSGIYIFGDISSIEDQFYVKINTDNSFEIQIYNEHIKSSNISKYLIFKKFFELVKNDIMFYSSIGMLTLDAGSKLKLGNIDKTLYAHLFDYYEGKINYSNEKGLRAIDQLDKINLYLYKVFLSKNMSDNANLMFNEEGNLRTNKKFKIFTKSEASNKELTETITKLYDDDVNEFQVELIDKLNRMQIKESIMSVEAGDDTKTKKINSYLQIPKLEITKENKYQLKFYIEKKSKVFKKSLFTIYQKIMKDLNLKGKISIKNYIIENIENDDIKKLLGLTTLLNNIKYILNTSLKIDKPNDMEKSTIVDLNLDVFASLKNLPFGKFINYTLSKDNICKFEINESKLKNKLRFLMEFTFGIIREDQIDILVKIITNIENKDEYYMYQAIMAAGKTAVLTPYLALYYYLKGKKFMIITLSTLIQTTFYNLLEKSSLLFNVPTFELKFRPTVMNRKDNIKPSNIFNENNKLVNGVYILSDLEYKVSILNHEKFRFVHNIDKVENYNDSNKIDIYEEYKNSTMIMDEVDDILDVVKSELNYPKSLASGKNNNIFEKDLSNIEKVDKNIINFIFKLSYSIFMKEFNSPDEFEVDLKHIVRIKNNKGIYNKNDKLISIINECFSKDSSKKNKYYSLLSELGIDSDTSLIGGGNLADPEQSVLAHIETIADLNIQNKIFSIINDDINKIKDMIPNRNYGLANSSDYKEIKEYTKTEFLAIPYDGLRKPAYGSEFSNVYLTIILTCFIYFINGLSFDNIINCLIIINQRYLDLHAKINNPLDKKSEAEKEYLEKDKKIIEDNYKKLSSFLPILKLPENILYLNNKIIELKDSKQFIKIPNLLINSDTKDIFNLYLEVNVNNHIKLSEANYNLSSNDILQKNITSQLAGYTGTLYIKDILNVEKQIKNPNGPEININELLPVDSVDGEIYSSLLGKKINIGISYFYISNYSNNDERTEKILEKISIEKYRALIDVGSLFYDDTNDIIAKKWAKNLKKLLIKQGYVLFLDNKNNKYVYNIANTDPNLHYERFDPIKHKKEDLYIYFDQSHITGIDIKLPTNAKGLVTVSENTNLRDLAQGSYRLREIKSGQSFDIILSELAKEKSEITNLPEFLSKVTALKEHRLNFLDWILKNQNKQDENKNSAHIKQTLRTYTRMALFNDDPKTNFNKLKSNESFKDLVSRQKTNFNISPYCLITKIPKIINSSDKQLTFNGKTLTFKGDNIKKTLDEYMIQEHISILEIIGKLNTIAFNLAKNFNDLSINTVEITAAKDQEATKEKSKEKEKEKLQLRSIVLTNKLDNLKPDNLELEVIEQLKYRSYLKIKPSDKKFELLGSDIKVSKINIKYYNMFLSYFIKTEENPELDINPILLNPNKTESLVTLINKFFTNYVPILPGINLSKYIYNNNRDILKARDELRHIVTSPGIILLNENFKNNIFIISLSEYLNIKNKYPESLTNISFYSLVGKHLQGTNNLKENDIRKILITIIAIINGKYILNDLEKESFHEMLLIYFSKINGGKDFFNLFIEQITIQYKINNNYFEDTPLPNIERTLTKMNGPKYTNLNWEKKYLKYKNKYLLLKNKYKL